MGKTYRIDKTNLPDKGPKSKTRKSAIKNTKKKLIQKAYYPRRIWPTDQERHKGPKSG